LQQAIAHAKPDLVLLPHTYQVRDFAPMLAASLGKGMIGDCIGYRQESGKLIFCPPDVSGKNVADVVFEGAAPWFATFQPARFARTWSRKAHQSCDHAGDSRSQAGTSSHQAARAFPRSKASGGPHASAHPRVGGQGIKAPENIPLAEKLAHLLGGELAASRPICDEGWLPMDRQIGSSGQTVAPKLYLALGISGAIQHVVGMKGSRTIVAINKDQNAPIFEVADYGIVGDLFEIVPALIEELERNNLCDLQSISDHR